jgi:hypothetical protein
LGTGDQLRTGKIPRTRCGPLDKIRDAVAQIQKLALLVGRKEPLCKARLVEGGPEAIAGISEVVAHGSRVETGVDTAEENLQIGRDNVGYGFALRGLDLLTRRFVGFHRSPFLITSERTRLVYIERGNSATDREYQGYAELLKARVGVNVR